MPKTAVMKSANELEAEVLELVQNGLILYPDRAAPALAGLLWNGPDADCLFGLGRALVIRYLIRAINAERRKAKPKPETLPLFPGLDHLPHRIVTPDGKRPLLAKATATEIRAYVKGLNKRHRERIAELKSVLAIMTKYTPENRGLTAAEVAKMEAER